jgi:hypothetical protein
MISLFLYSQNINQTPIIIENTLVDNEQEEFSPTKQKKIRVYDPNHGIRIIFIFLKFFLTLSTRCKPSKQEDYQTIYHRC